MYHSHIHTLTPSSGYTESAAQVVPTLSHLSPLRSVSDSHPHPQTLTDFLVSASVSRGVNTSLFDESVQKQPGDLPWHVHTHTHTQLLGKCHVV